MPLVDIAQMHRKYGHTKVFSHFFNSGGYRRAYEHLTNNLQLPEEEVLVRSMPSRSNPSVAKVHPLIAMEYILWADYPRYAKLAERLL